MAHRGLQKEMFGLLCVAMIWPKSEKVTPPAGRTGYIIEAIDAIDDRDLSKIILPSLPTPPTPGFLSYLLPFVVTAVSLLGEELVNMIAFYLLNHGLLLLLRVLRSLLVVFGTFACRRIRALRALGLVTAYITRWPTDKIDDSSRLTSSTAITVLSDTDDKWFNAEESQPSSAEASSASPTNEQVLRNLRAESAEKDAQISNLRNTTRSKSNEIASLGRRYDGLLGNLRKALDPSGLYLSNQDVIVMANDLVRDFQRVSKKVDRQKSELEQSRAWQENGRLAQKDAEIARLSGENNRLGLRVLDLEVGQQSSVQQVEQIEKETQDRVERFRRRTRTAESTALTAISPRQYNLLRDQFDTILGKYNEAEAGRKAAVNELQATRAGTGAAVLQQPEGPVTESAGDLQLANDKIESLEQETQALYEAVGDAEVRARGAAMRARGAEKRTRSTERRARSKERRARSEKKSLQVADKRARAAEATAREAKAKAQGAEARIQAAEDLRASAHQELREARDQNKGLREAQQKPGGKDASIQTEQQGEDLYKQGYDAACGHCEEQAKTLLAQVVGRERNEAQERLDTALVNRDALWRNQVNAQVESSVAERERPLQAELSTALQRATIAEASINDATAKLTEAQDSAVTERLNTAIEWQRGTREEKRANMAEERASTAEEEVRRYKEGKASQDERIKNCTAEIAALKKKIPQNADLAAAELQYAVCARARLQNIVYDSMSRHYDFATRQVVSQLLRANNQINDFKLFLKRSLPMPDRVGLLKELEGADVDTNMYMSLDQESRKVVVTQCKAANLRLSHLRMIIKQSAKPSKEELLTELYKVRGDEEYPWVESESEPSSDEDEDDESSRPQNPTPRQTRIPTSRTARPAANTQVQTTPLPSDPRADNQLKRKNDLEKGDGGASSKRQDASEMDMRPTVGPFIQSPRQGSSAPEAPDNTLKTESKSENKVTSRVEEASASQQQSNGQAGISPLLPAISATPLQYTTSMSPAPTLIAPSQVAHPPKSNSTKIPGPKPKARLPSTQRQERLRWVQYPESEAVSAQESAASSSAQGPTGFSFSMPKDIASAVAKPTPAQPNHNPIFKGLSLLGAAMADKKWMTDKKAALPGLPPPEEDQVLEFESSAVTEDHDADRVREREDSHLTHKASDDEEDEETVWEDALYPPSDDDNLNIELDAGTSTRNGNLRQQSLAWLDDPQLPVRALDMTEQNYEEQAAEAAAKPPGTQKAAPKKDSQSQGGKEEQEDTFHIDLD